LGDVEENRRIRRMEDVFDYYFEDYYFEDYYYYY
jgi:hypothetical protein